MAYQLFLTDLDAELLIFNSFLWICIFRVFRGERFAPVSPIKSIRTSVDSYHLAFALGILGYWTLFWYGLKLVPAGENASKTAVAVLALNTVLAPIAAYFALARKDRPRTLRTNILFGMLLFLALIMMEVDASAANIQEYLYALENRFITLLSPQSTATDQQVGFAIAFNIEELIIIPAIVCLLGAVASEAAADYFNGRRQEIAKTQMGQTIRGAHKTAASVTVLRRSMKEQSISRWIQYLSKQIESELDGWEKDYETACDALNVLRQTKLTGHYDINVAAKKITEANQLIQQLKAELSDLSKLTARISEFGDKSVTRRDRRTVIRKIEERYWSAAFDEATKASETEIDKVATQYVKDSGEDVVAVLGVVVSGVIFIGAGSFNGFVEGPAVLGQLVALMMVGALGSTARIIFINPIVRENPRLLQLVPQIYAVRPLLLLIMMFVFINLMSADDLLAQLKYFSSIDTSIDLSRNIGWLLGALVSLCVAIGSWLVFARKIFQKDGPPPPENASQVVQRSGQS